MGDIELEIFSQRLRELRLSLEMTQKEFAKELGITASALSSYEKNNINPSISIAKRIAEKYHVSIDWLCGLSDKKDLKHPFQTYGDIVSVLFDIDDYLTGIEIVDLEHQQLFCIVERAYQLVKSNDVITCYDELLSIIHELTDYTVTHFADEEAYMEKIGYEGLAAQKNAHASFVARLESINLIELDENPQKYMESLIEFLLGWLINHILYSDKKIPVQA